MRASASRGRLSRGGAARRRTGRADRHPGRGGRPPPTARQARQDRPRSTSTAKIVIAAARSRPTRRRGAHLRLLHCADTPVTVTLQSRAGRCRELEDGRPRQQRRPVLLQPGPRASPRSTRSSTTAAPSARTRSGLAARTAPSRARGTRTARASGPAACSTTAATSTRAGAASRSPSRRRTASPAAGTATRPCAPAARGGYSVRDLRAVQRPVVLPLDREGHQADVREGHRRHHLHLPCADARGAGAGIGG